MKKRIDEFTREECIAWLVENDSNGVWTDKDSLAEGMQPITLESAQTNMQGMLCAFDTADECHLYLERSVAGISDTIPACPIHGK